MWRVGNKLAKHKTHFWVASTFTSPHDSVHCIQCCNDCTQCPHCTASFPQCSVHRWLRAAAGCSLLSHTTPTPIDNVNMTRPPPPPIKVSTWHTHDHLHNQHDTSSSICSPPNNINMTQTQSTSLPTSTGYKHELFMVDPPKCALFQSNFFSVWYNLTLNLMITLVKNIPLD